MRRSIQTVTIALLVLRTITTSSTAVGSGATILDYSGNARDGEAFGGYTLGVPGALANGDSAMSFDGASSFIQLPGTWGGWSSATIEAWVNTSAVTHEIRAIVSATDTAFAHFQLREDPIASHVIWFYGATNLPMPEESPTGVWRHMVFVGESGNTRLYVDGVLISSSATSFSTITSSSDVHIGSGHQGLRFFNGVLDEVAVYDSALSEDRILAHYDAAAALDDAYASEVLSDNPAGYWRMNDGNDAPACGLATEFVAEESGEYVVTVGDTFFASLTGTDPDPGDELAISASGAPGGSSLSPPDGATGSSPIEVSFEWAPADGDAAGNPHLVEVAFTDLAGLTASCQMELIVNRHPIAACAQTSINVECESPDGEEVTLDGSLSSDPDGDEIMFHWDVSDLDVALDDSDSASPSGIFPIGVTMATLTVADGRGGVAVCDVVVTVEDTTPPEVMCTTDIASLWPPKHDMREVTVYVVATDLCEDPDFVFPLIVTVRSDEADDANGNGDGSTTGDVDGQDGYSAALDITSKFSFDETIGDDGAWVATIELRAERDGAGDGRAYIIDVSAFDSQGNIATTSCVVVAPHDRRGGNN